MKGIKCIEQGLPYGYRISEDELFWGRAETHGEMPLGKGSK